MTKREIQQKQEITEIKTYPVPFALKEIKENMTIIYNTPSKEEIINQAFNFHSKGNIQKAAKYYQYFINQGYTDHIVFSNYGVILKNLGKLHEAEISLRKAVELNPDFVDAHCNLGSILSDLGKLKEAEISTRKAIKLKPDFVNAHLNLGEILYELEKTEEASISEWNAIKLNPSFAYFEAYREKAKLINKIAFYVYSYSVFNHFRAIIEINPNRFEILVKDNFYEVNKCKIRSDLNNKDIRIRSVSEVLEKKSILRKTRINTR